MIDKNKLEALLLGNQRRLGIAKSSSSIKDIRSTRMPMKDKKCGIIAGMDSEISGVSESSDDYEKRVYTLQGSTETLDIIEKIFHTFQVLGHAGASRTVKVFFDGDGSARIKVKKEGGKLAECEVDTDQNEINFGIGV